MCEAVRLTVTPLPSCGSQSLPVTPLPLNSSLQARVQSGEGRSRGAGRGACCWCVLLLARQAGRRAGWAPLGYVMRERGTPQVGQNSQGQVGAGQQAAARTLSVEDDR